LFLSLQVATSASAKKSNPDLARSGVLTIRSAHLATED
jgi:hypothetical protein